MGGGNQIVRDCSSLFKDTIIVIKGENNLVQFGNHCRISGLKILVSGDNNRILIGNNVIVNASKDKPTVVNALEGKKVVIGDGALLSNNIEIHTSDYHGIFDITSGARINTGKDVIIHENVWIGLRCIILKGTEIASGCVVGAGSLLAGKYESRNCILLGNPVSVRKKNIIWKMDLAGDCKNHS